MRRGSHSSHKMCYGISHRNGERRERQTKISNMFLQKILISTSSKVLFDATNYTQSIRLQLNAPKSQPAGSEKTQPYCCESCHRSPPEGGASRHCSSYNSTSQLRATMPRPTTPSPIIAASKFHFTVPSLTEDT